MKIKTKLYLLIFLPVLALLFFLSYDIYETTVIKNNLEQVHLRVVEAKYVIGIIENIQLERALGTGYLITGEYGQYEDLKIQKEKTNQSIKIWEEFEKAGKEEQPHSAGLLKNLDILRAKVDNLRITGGEAYQDYTDIILALFNSISDITMIADNSQIKNELILHADILYSIELLGQMRGTIYMVLLKGEVSGNDIEKLAIIQEDYDTGIQDFLRNAPVEVVEYYDQKLEKSDIPLTLKVINTILQDFSREKVRLSPDTWLKLSTSSIETLDEVQNHFLKKIEQDTLNIIKDNNRKMNIKIIVFLVIIGLTIITAFSIINNIITNTKNFIKTISCIVSTKDFSQRIEIRSNDEISLVGKSFNELMDIIAQLIKEKETNAATDTLTQAFSRYKFNQVLSSEVAAAKANKTSLAFIMIDIDHFKRINDTYGHHIGDDILRGVADVIRTQLCQSDILTRWGGEEFVILAPYTDILAATALAEKIRKAIARSRIKDGLTVTCSLGVTEFRSDDTELSFSKRADGLLYQAKDGGRNRICVD